MEYSEIYCKNCLDWRVKVGSILIGMLNLFYTFYFAFNYKRN